MDAATAAHLEQIARELTADATESAALLVLLRGFVSLGAADREHVRRVALELLAEQRRARRMH